MKLAIALAAAAIAVGSTATFAQEASQQGAPTAATVNSWGDRTEPGAVNRGSSLGAPTAPTMGGPVVVVPGEPVTVGSAGYYRAPVKEPSEQGAPTAAGANSYGSRTEPGAVVSGASR